jgi:hypothetical protein
LRGVILPEDLPQVETAHALYPLESLVPTMMPDSLASFVHLAAHTTYGRSQRAKRIPELSAVATNVRPARTGQNAQPPRFWYMLPDFTRRHLPDAFVARINQDIPWVVANLAPPILIDANFSTFWSEDGFWPPLAMVGLLNSSWARACMEAVGTPMGGGALKLEATHLRRLPIPHLKEGEIHQLAQLGKHLPVPPPGPPQLLDAIDEVIINAILQQTSKNQAGSSLKQSLREFAQHSQQARQRR